jgi:hypothetical protein
MLFLTLFPWYILFRKSPKLCYVLNHLGLIVSWDCDTANVYDGTAFQQLVDDLADEMVVFSDTAFTK